MSVVLRTYTWSPYTKQEARDKKEGAAMAYTLLRIFDEVDAQLSSDPRCTLHNLSRILREDRHDIEKSVREAKGVTFREFKKSKLLEICLTFLTGNRDLRIKHIAITLGFRRRRDFSRFIKNSTGRTPTEIRNR